MKIIKGLFLILVHLGLGIIVSKLICGFIPGSVAGMLLLFLSLITGVVKQDSVREVALFLTGNMTVFFLPAMVGIMNIWGLIRVNFLGWLIVLVGSAVIVMATSGLVQELVEFIRNKEGKK